MTVNLERDVTELFRAKLHEFCEWCAKEWTVTELEARNDNLFDTKPAGYREGYNAALEGLTGALDCWMEDGA